MIGIFFLLCLLTGLKSDVPISKLCLSIDRDGLFSYRLLMGTNFCPSIESTLDAFSPSTNRYCQSKDSFCLSIDGHLLIDWQCRFIDWCVPAFSPSTNGYCQSANNFCLSIDDHPSSMLGCSNVIWESVLALLHYGKLLLPRYPYAHIIST